MRRFGRLLALPVLLSASGCGACLLVQNQEVELRTPLGTTEHVVVTFRTPDGILNLESPGRRLLLGFLLEPVDWVLSTSGAIQAAFSRETDVALGPIGWLLTLTPFATLFPAPYGGVRQSLEVDAATLERMRAGDLEATRAAFGDYRIRAVTFR
jgi:hypothetical protein